MTSANDDHGGFPVRIRRLTRTDIHPVFRPEAARPFIAARPACANLFLVALYLVQGCQQDPACEIFWVPRCGHEAQHATPSTGFCLEAEDCLDCIHAGPIDPSRGRTVLCKAKFLRPRGWHEIMHRGNYRGATAKCAEVPCEGDEIAPIAIFDEHPGYSFHIIGDERTFELV